jgi:isomerase DpgB
VVNRWERALRRLERLDHPVIAVIGGEGASGRECGGTALDAMLTADFRIAAADVRLIAPWGPRGPGGQSGVWPGMALYRLVNQGGAAARRTVLFGAPIAALDAIAAHLLDQVAEDPDAALAEVCDRLTTACEGLGVRRQLMFDAGNVSFEEALGRHLAACDRVLRLAGAGAEDGAGADAGAEAAEAPIGAAR